ncbi:MAG: VWA domain-containing protein [Burkholderiales bacterium]|uniref:vWA domain-containing protein n=1 Tax=Nitrosomonas sp. TaxID=42353 RepID=UPI001D45F83C|nr:VWA domain-containing protein [Nitrosomonas sp.]MCB1716388.1 VWA domain-containing protein [Candidatus Competibacteraceae bacterium]MCB1949674.1 VWA domain-containing protein [Nitrosomonas sp.]MCP5242489.1 VWA domain-containing protein [Burkholderiales bacterium]
MFEFAWPWMFLCLPLPWLFRRMLPPAVNVNQGVLFAPFIGADQESFVATRRLSLRSPRLWGLCLCWLLLILASARPQWVGEETELPETGRDLILAVDVSGSMEIADMGDGRANRMDVVKQVAGDFIRRREGDRIGLILFGSEAYLQTPLTFDHATVANLLQDTVIGIAGRETAIGDAIGMAIKHMRHLRHTTEEAVLVLLTDGANNAGHVLPRKAAELAAQQGLRVYTIGVGGEAREMQSFFGMRTINPASDLDEETLRMIADLTGGQYFRATDRNSLESIYHQLDRLEPTLEGSRIVRPAAELFIWPLGLGLITSFLLAFYWKRAG